MTDPRPTLVDRGLAHVRDQRLTMQSLLWTLAASTVYVPSGTDPGEDLSGFQPVFFEREGTQMLAAFTTPDGASTLGHLGPFIAVFTGEELVLRMPAEYGLVVNAGSELAFDVPPLGLSALRQELMS